MSISETRPSARAGTDEAARGWTSRLAITVTAWLIVQSLTGLWMYLGPFSINAQIQMLVHVVLGVLFLVPYLYYQVRHWLVWWRQTPTAAMVLGYALMLAVLVTSVSGVVLTTQAALGPKIGPLWDLVHLVSGLAAFGLLAVHLLFAWWRRRIAFRKDTALAPIPARFGVRAAGLVVAVSIIVGTLTWSTENPDYVFEVPDDYRLPEYAQQFEEYRGNPFSPTYARTEELNLVSTDLLAHSDSCGTAGCHEEILAEWEPSAHRFSAMNPPFQKVQKDFAADRGTEETRYCAGCHDPISLFAGAKDIHNLDLAAPGMQEGISCVSCHSISQVDQRGNADYVLTPPRKYLWEATEGTTKFVSDFLIRAYPQQHLVDYDRNVLRTPEYCGACHKQFIPEALNRFGFSEGQNQYDEWRKSHWNADDPDQNLSCRDCHMRLVADSKDPGRGEEGDQRRTDDDGTHRHHGFIAANVFMPELMALPNWERHVELTEEWLRGETVLPEIADVYPTGPVASIQIRGPEQVEPGETVELTTVVTNRKAGHNYTTGPLDFLRSWVHLTVHDEAGDVLAEWGSIDPESRRITDQPGEFHEIGNSRSEGTLVLESLPVNDKGEVLREHQLWQKAGGKGKRVIFPNYSDAQVFRLQVPDHQLGQLTIRAELQYRRYRQEFLDLALPGLEEEAGVFQPTVTQASADWTIRVVAPPQEQQE